MTPMTISKQQTSGPPPSVSSRSEMITSLSATLGVLQKIDDLGNRLTFNPGGAWRELHELATELVRMTKYCL